MRAESSACPALGDRLCSCHWLKLLRMLRPCVTFKLKLWLAAAKTFESTLALEHSSRRISNGVSPGGLLVISHLCRTHTCLYQRSGQSLSRSLSCRRARQVQGLCLPGKESTAHQMPGSVFRIHLSQDLQGPKHSASQRLCERSSAWMSDETWKITCMATDPKGARTSGRHHSGGSWAQCWMGPSS